MITTETRNLTTNIIIKDNNRDIMAMAIYTNLDSGNKSININLQPVNTNILSLHKEEIQTQINNWFDTVLNVKLDELQYEYKLKTIPQPTTEVPVETPTEPVPTP